MEYIALIIGMAIGLWMFVVVPWLEEKKEAAHQTDYLKFKEDLDKAKEENRKHFQQIRERQERYFKEQKQCYEYAKSCINIVTMYRKDVDDDEWIEWMLNPNAACMPISIGKILQNLSHPGINMTPFYLEFNKDWL